jgi:hypothetical protein
MKPFQNESDSLYLSHSKTTINIEEHAGQAHLGHNSADPG